MEYTKDQLIQQVLGGINPAGPTTSQEEKRKQNKANLYILTHGNWNDDQSIYKFNKPNPPPFTMESPPKEKPTARALDFDNTEADAAEPPKKPEKPAKPLPNPTHAPPPKLDFDNDEAEQAQGTP